MNPGAGHLSDRKQPRKSRPSIHVGPDPAHLEMGGRTNRRRCRLKIETKLKTMSENLGESLGHPALGKMGQGKKNSFIRKLPGLKPQCPGNNIPGGKFPVGMVVVQESSPFSVDNPCTLSPHGLGEKKGSLAGNIQNGRMKLVISHPFDLAACPGGNSDTVSPLKPRVCGAEKQGAPSSCRKDCRSGFDLEELISRFSQKDSSRNHPFPVLPDTVELEI